MSRAVSTPCDDVLLYIVIMSTEIDVMYNIWKICMYMYAITLQMLERRKDVNNFSHDFGHKATKNMKKNGVDLTVG